MNDQSQECTNISLDNPLLIPFLQRLQIDPDDYEANKAMACSLSREEGAMPLIEGFLVRALSHNRTDDPEYEDMLKFLALILEYKGELEESIKVFISLATTYPNNLRYAINLADLYFQNGQRDAASDLYKRLVSIYLASAQSVARTVGGPITQILEPLKIMRSHFGELAGKLDFYAKARVLGITPKVRALLPLSEDEVVNGCLLECLRHSLSDHITFVSEPDNRDVAMQKYKLGRVHLDHFVSANGCGMPRDVMYTPVQRQWEKSGHGPLVTMPDRYDDMGRDLLRRHGVPDDAWFVCFHVRDMGFHNEKTASSEQNTYRNADIKDYIPAIKAVRERGGWVIRIGDPTMPRLPEIEGVIDYAVCDWRQDWIDIFLISRQRFLVCTASGPPAVALAFGVPIVATNWFPAGLWLPSTRDTVIHKLYRRRDNGNYLTIEEIVKPPIGGIHSKPFLDLRGIDVEDNSPDDIRDAVVEMIDRLDGTAEYTPEDERLQQRFKTLADGMDVGVNPRAGRDFLRRHRFLLGE